MGRTPFASFFQAGFECSSHRRRDGVRLDLIRATAHDQHVLQDYRLCKQLGFRTIRDGLALAPDRNSRRASTTGRAGCRRSRRPSRSGSRSSGTCSTTARPIMSTRPADDFPERFTDFALAAIELQQSISKRPPLVCPLNEISFLSWAVDDGLFPARRAGRNRLASSASWSGPRSRRRKRSGSAGPTPRSSGPSP